MNILITSSGRRVELVRLAKKALSDCGESGKVFAADASTTAPTSKFCDAFEIVPPIASSAYIDSLLKICLRRGVDILIPTIDTELPAIAAAKPRFEAAGVLVNISSEKVVEICNDKFKTSRFFAENSIPAPKFYACPAREIPSAQFPLFVKPADGASSINAFRADTPEELKFFANYVPNALVEEFVAGVEYSVDVFCDETAAPITIVPRRRIAVRAGEILRGRTERDADVIDASRKLVAALKPFGHITLQCIKNSRGVFFIEVNPRFGGGVPMSIMAGADSLANLVKLKRGEKLAYSEDWRDALTFSRFDDSVIV